MSASTSAIQVGGAIVSSIITSSFAKADAAKQRELEEMLGRLSLDQQKELEIRLQDVQGEVEKQKIVYQYLAIKNNQDAINAIKSKRYTSYIILGGSIFLLAIVVILLKRKNE
jgi:hypothetical protein